jgi:hypothetical protein
MKINNLEVTSNFFEQVDETCVHCELGGCIRLVHIVDTDFETIEDLKKQIEILIFD